MDLFQDISGVSLGRLLQNLKIDTINVSESTMRHFFNKRQVPAMLGEIIGLMDNLTKCLKLTTDSLLSDALYQIDIKGMLWR